MDDVKVLRIIAQRKTFTTEDILREYSGDAVPDETTNKEVREYLRQLCSVNVLEQKKNVYRALVPLVDE